MPPYSSGTDMPSTPRLASFFMFCEGNEAAMYLIGSALNSLCASARTVAIICRCCDVISKVMQPAWRVREAGTIELFAGSPCRNAFANLAPATLWGEGNPDPTRLGRLQLPAAALSAGAAC